jgi:hypothetical protein
MKTTINAVRAVPTDISGTTTITCAGNNVWWIFSGMPMTIYADKTVLADMIGMNPWINAVNGQRRWRKSGVALARGGVLVIQFTIPGPVIWVGALTSRINITIIIPALNL